MGHNLNPRVGNHALRKARRFGIPKSAAHSWIVNKIRDAVYLGPYGKGHLYQNGGVFFIMIGRFVKTVMQPDEIVKEISRQCADTYAESQTFFAAPHAFQQALECVK